MPTRAEKTPGVREELRQHQGLRLLEEIGAVLARTSQTRAGVQRLVELVAEYLSMEVCSLYAYRATKRVLTLWATTGLDAAAIDNVQMKDNEGLTGVVVQRREPVMAIDALVHPRYKYFPETGEERYHSFLGVPVLERGELRGVLVVQTSRRRRCTPTEIRLLKTIAVVVAGILGQRHLQARLDATAGERAASQQRVQAAIEEIAHNDSMERRFRLSEQGVPVRLSGLAAAPGFGMGRAHLLRPDISFAGVKKERRYPLKRELQRFRVAVTRSVKELERTKERLQASVPEVDVRVFDSHRLMIQDRSLQARVEALIREGNSAEAALEITVDEFVGRFQSLENAYMQARAADVRDIGQRLLRHLLGVGERQQPFMQNVVLVASDAVLSDLTLVEQEDLQGVVLVGGGSTSHVSILAKSMEIPTVVGVEHCDELIKEGDRLIVDGNAGVVYANPTPEVLREYQRLQREYRTYHRDLERLRDLPTETRDGHRVTISANIGLLTDMQLACTHGAEGIGLYRTEVLFLSHRDFLSEDEQYAIYQRVVAGMEGKPVTIRTLDLGADKYPSYLSIPHEENPFLGWRSIRISLEFPELFQQQLRAILRAGAVGPVQVLFPMIASVEEILRAKEQLAIAQQALQADGVPHAEQVAVGAMVEVPAAVYLLPQLAAEVDFLSIGTNDLIQYLLAVDRNNRKVSPLYQPLHPAVLHCLSHAVQAARRAQTPISICGEMAADPMCSAVLVGMGLDNLSTGPMRIPTVKRLLRAVTYAEVQQLAQDVLQLGTVKEVKACVFEMMRRSGVVDIMEA